MKLKIKRHGVALVLIMYWVILILWQNMFGQESRTTIDIIIKVMVFSMLLGYYFLHTSEKINNVVPLCFFSLCVTTTFFLEETYSLSIYISHLFLLVFVFCVFGIGNNYKIKLKDYIVFLKIIICVALYMSLYSIIYFPENFLNAFSIRSAYGNELMSFLTSSHDYGLYLSAAIIGCFFCLMKTKEHKFFYKTSIVILMVNLLLTYSRTTIFSTVIFFMSYFLMIGNRKTKKYFFCFFSLIFVLICSIPELSNFLYFTVNKGGDLAGRDVLTTLSIDFFLESNFVNEIFGNGISNVRNMFVSSTDIGSAHNAYLDILLTYGTAGFAILICFLSATIHKYLYSRVISKEWRSYLISLVIWGSALMISNTFIIFTSQLDSYFITIFSFVVPKYIFNQLVIESKNI